jgi:hypothetical protein
MLSAETIQVKFPVGFLHKGKAGIREVYFGTRARGHGIAEVFLNDCSVLNQRGSKSLFN